MPTAVEEKDAIREILAQYCLRLDDGRFAEMAALSTENGTWDTAYGRATGRSALADLARSLRERAGDQRPRAVHLVTNISISLDGMSAQVRSNWPSCKTVPKGQKSARAAPITTSWSKSTASGCAAIARSTASSRPD